jgi:cytochrome c biogenesis protein ResB
MKENALQEAETSQEGHDISQDEADKLRDYLSLKKYKQRKTEAVTVFYRGTSGYYGSFVVHLSMFLILVFGGLVLGLSEVEDHRIMPNETVMLCDGTLMTLYSFRTTDEDGRTDYESIIRVTAPDGSDSGPRAISVNHPLTFRSNKFYQHRFGTVGAITATNIATGGYDVLYMFERNFMTLDGRNGIWFEAMFPGYVEDEDGNILPLIFNTNIFPDPIYYIMVSSMRHTHYQFFKPGESVVIGGIEFTFNLPVEYPSIRVKHTPILYLALLYASFVLMTAGFWLCFFHLPAVVSVRNSSYNIIGSNVGIKLEIDALLKDEKEIST